jgi:hypothetical protein
VPYVSKADRIREWLKEHPEDKSDTEIARRFNTRREYVYLIRTKKRAHCKIGNPHRNAKTVSQAEACARYLDSMSWGPFTPSYLASEIRKGMWRPYQKK